MEEKRFRLTLAYDGTDFVGSQSQGALRTVQSVLESVVESVHGVFVRIDFSGRTDSGVHALGMIAAYTVRTRMVAERVRRALNSRLPEDLRVCRVEEVSLEFHPRFDAKSKLYRYRLWVEEQAHPLLRRLTWHLYPKLDEELVRQGCELLRGKKDFRAFQSTGSGVYDTVRTLERVELRRKGSLWIFEFEGDGFLRYQVRAMIGTLVELGRGRLSLARLEEALRTGRRELAGPTAPAQGLVLVRVRYRTVDT